MTMTEEEKNNAAAYMKLQDDVKQLIIDTVYKELGNYGGLLHNQIKTGVIYSSEFNQKVKDVIKDQMMKY
jgi:hypothetical protein